MFDVLGADAGCIGFFCCRLQYDFPFCYEQTGICYIVFFFLYGRAQNAATFARGRKFFRFKEKCCNL
jgi:hypothetical protein